MQDKYIKQEVRELNAPPLPPVAPHIPMIAPEKKKEERNKVFLNSSYSNAKKELELEEASFLFNIIKRSLIRPYNNWRDSSSNKLYDVDYILECTIANVKFDFIKSKYNQKTYLKHFKHLHDIKAVRKVNPKNQKCHKYYVNPDFYHRLQRYNPNKNEDSACQIYYDNHMWIWE